MKGHTHTSVRATLVVAVVAVLAVFIAPQAFAAAATVTGNITGGSVDPGVPASLGITVTVSTRTLDTFTLTAPTGWKLISIDSGPATGTAAISTDPLTCGQSAPTSCIVASGLGVSGNGSANLGFTVGTGCASGASGWTLAAKDTQGRSYGVNASSNLTTNVSGNCHLAITTQPADARATEIITNTQFDQTGPKVQVSLLNNAQPPVLVDYFPITVSLGLLLDGVPATGISGNSQTASGGVATFSSLAVSVPDVAQTSAYTLVPTSNFSGISGSASDPFDVWEKACVAPCKNTLNHGNGSSDEYTSDPNAPSGLYMSASTVGAVPSWLQCEGQIVIFGNDVFAVEQQGPAGTVVFLKSHVTRKDMKAATQNGQAHVEWCVALDSSAPWDHNGAPYSRIDLNGDSVPDVFVGVAPACPKASPSDFMPCFTRQYGDGNGGNYTEGFLPGDPTRRT